MAKTQQAPQRLLTSLSSVPAVQRKCACGGVSKLGGQCSGCESKKLVGGNGPLIQAKLKIGAPNDVYEQEADRVAEQVMRMPEPKQKNTSQGNTNTDRTKSGLLAGNSEISIQRQKDDFLQAKSTPGYTPQVTPNVAANIQNLKSGGQPLPPTQRHFFESRMGQDFSGVRIHTDSKAADTAQTIQAKAFTLGNNIVFNTGQYSHDNQEGKKLLAHELTHVVQQSGADGMSVGRSKENHGLSPNSSLETADRKPARPAGFRLQRDPKPPLNASDNISGVQARLDKIIRTGGPLPTDKTRVVGALIVDVEGYTGPREMRALSGVGTDALGRDALVFHASSPTDRTLSATREIKAAPGRHEWNLSHVNDAEMKMFEEVKKHLPPDPKGTIHFSTMKHLVKGGEGELKAIPACSGCNRASFEMGAFRGLNIASHAAPFPTGSLDIAKTAASRIVPLDDATLKAMPRKPPAWVHYPKKGSGRQWFRENASDADLDPKTGKVVDGPKTRAAQERQKKRQQARLRRRATKPVAPATAPETKLPRSTVHPASEVAGEAAASTGGQPEPPRAAAQHRSGRPRPAAVTTSEIEADRLRLGATKRAAADIAAEIAPRPGRFARALGKLGKVARFGSKLLPFGSLLETYSLVKTFEAAEATIIDLAKQRDALEVPMMIERGYVPIYHKGVVVEYRKRPRRPAPKAEGRDTEAARVEEGAAVFSISGGALRKSESNVDARYRKIKFKSLTDIDVGIWKLSRSRGRPFNGYVLRRQYSQLKRLESQQRDLLNLRRRLERPSKPESEPDAAPAQDRAAIVVEIRWGDVVSTITFVARCDNTQTEDGSWKCSHKGSLDDLPEADEDYVVTVFYEDADGKKSDQTFEVFASSKTKVSGSLPDEALVLDSYPPDAAVIGILDEFVP